MNRLLLFMLLLPSYVLSQVNLKTIRQKGYQHFVYSVYAKDVEQYIQQDSIPVNNFLNQTAVDTFTTDYFDTDLLPGGHYVIISAVGTQIVADLVAVSNLIVYPVNNHHNIELEVRTQKGDFIPNAKVWVGKKEAKYNIDSKNYWLKRKKLRYGLVKVYTPTDTLFVQLDASEDAIQPLLVQRWNNFKRTKIGALVNFLPNKITSLIKGKRKYKSNNISATGYMLFNQPKYKLTDTVRLKTYIFNRRWKQYKKTADVFLEYYNNGKNQKQLLTKLSPVSAGSFVYSFPLSDTLPTDVSYKIAFKNKKGQNIISKSFSTEDYLPDEIGSYRLRTSKDTYYAGDSLQFFLSAKDANELSLLDAKATLVLSVRSITECYKDSLQIPDTLFTQTKVLLTDGETNFSIPASLIPNAKLTLNASVIFQNSNNETQEESKVIEYMPQARQLVVTIKDDQVYAAYLVNGRSVAGSGSVNIWGDELDRTMNVYYPATVRFDPLADTYDFILIDGKDTLTETADIKSIYSLSLTRTSRQDTLGFILNNPAKIPVNFQVMDGGKIIYAGKDEIATITWSMIVKNKQKMYTVRWQYLWAGEHREGQENIALLYKLLQINITNEALVFPGQKDTITIDVLDYKNRPAKKVNLAAVAYNSQFKKGINVKEPPYLVKYKNKPGVVRDTHETDDPYPLKKYKLGNYKAWIKKLSLDTMPYYKILFPKIFPYDIATPIIDFIPQLSVHVVKNGEPQPIYLLYVNRQLAYYNGVTDSMKYAFETMQGYTQIGMRLFDKYVEIDSLYMQPFYKHDLVINLDSLPHHSLVREMPNHLMNEEKKLLEKNIWQLDSNVATNSGFVWQHNHVTELTGNKRHLAGPFTSNDSLHFYAPGNFDIHFPFEPGYEYDLSKKITRLEKKSIFPNDTCKVKLPVIKTYALALGDIITAPPIINYAVPVASKPDIIPSVYNDYNPYTHTSGNGKLKLAVAKDTVVKFVILLSEDAFNKNIFLRENRTSLINIPPGKYKLFLITNDFKSIVVDRIEIKASQTFCLNVSGIIFEKNDARIDSLAMLSHPGMTRAISEKSSVDESISKEQFILPVYGAGTNNIVGKVTDAKGKEGIPGAQIVIKGTKVGTTTKADGTFMIHNIKEGRHTLVVSSIGYSAREINITVYKDMTDTISIQLFMAVMNLQEVVVIGYGTKLKRDLTGSITTINSLELSSPLNGRLAGVSVSGAPGSNANVVLRGINSLPGDNHPIFVIDGVIYDELPSFITADMFASAEILKDAAATAIYGARASNGAVIITTGANTLRSNFKDYALWQPQLFTNADGKVSFEVVYPDNITGWELYVLAMDKKRRIGKGTSFTKAYKPLLAQLSTPQFLIENESAEFIGKAMNYTTDNYDMLTTFSTNKKTFYSGSTTLGAMASVIIPVKIATTSADTLQASFSLKTTTGFADGEERKIPVFKKGTEEATGSFYIMKGDTSLTFKPIANGVPIEVYAQNNTLDLLLNELEHLRKYPYYCMEQTASKIKGFAMEQKIKNLLQQPFKNENELKSLIKKIQTSQLFSGGWSWWEQGKPNLFITCYVVEALSTLKNKTAVESNIRNGLLFLQNQLATIKKDTLLQVLSTLSNANHLIDYQPYINNYVFDSLPQHQQWQWVKICQQQKLEHTKQLKQLVSKKIETITGGTHWGEENYLWYSNAIATTLLAYSVLEKEQEYQVLLPGIVQYFFEQRQKGYWRNTVESASIASAIVPFLTQHYSNFNSPATITVSGDTSFAFNAYPYSVTFIKNNSNPVTITKTGGGFTYLTLYQKWWNDEPVAVAGKFDIQTYFEKNGQRIIQIPAGEKMKMIVKVNVLKDADYVMIEVPIPAGCNYAGKPQDTWMHKAYYKNKMVVFAERLNKGMLKFEIDLEPRYKGNYTLNPAKAELMYFPTMFGRNDMRQVEIK